MQPSFARRFLRHLRAAAVAAGGSLYGLGIAVVLSRLTVPGSEWALLWLGVSLVSIGLAVRFGHRTPARGAAAIIGRTFSAVVLGGAFVLAVVLIAVEWTRPVAGAGVFAVAATVMLLAAYLTRHAWNEPTSDPEAPPIEPPPAGGILPTAPLVEPATSYALMATGPALTSEESEREAPAIEVRVLWGEDLLRVDHLTPPRSVHAGETACDIALGHDLLGAERAALVVVDGEGIRAMVPPGAKALVDRGAGGSGAIEGADGGSPVPLALGTRVTFSFSARSASAYRASATEAPVVVEIALVRAGRIVGRGLRLGDGWRPIAACLFAAAAAGGVLLPFAMKPAPPVEDEVSTEQMQEIWRHIQAVAEREEETPPEPRPSRGPYWGYWPYHSNAFLFEDGPYAPTGFDIQPGFATPFCAAIEEERAQWGVVPDERALYCASRVMTPFGLRGVWPASPDPFGRDPSDLWPFKHPRAARATSAGTVRLAPIKMSGRLPPEVVGRMIRENLGRLRLCYGEGLSRKPTLEGRMSVRLAIGRDGEVSFVSNGGSDLPDSQVVVCVVDTFRDLSFPAPEGGIVTVTQAMTFAKER